MKVAVISLGCDKNTVDTEMMLGILNGAGHELVYDEAEADAVVINTCIFAFSRFELRRHYNAGKSSGHALLCDQPSGEAECAKAARIRGMPFRPPTVCMEVRSHSLCCYFDLNAESVIKGGNTRSNTFRFKMIF